jgi:undecaprenyl-diphosphatase
VNYLLVALALLTPIEQLDWTVQHHVQEARSPRWEKVMRAATDIGRPPLALGVLLGIAAFGGPAGAATARAAVLALVPANLVVEGAKHSVGRMRPDGSRKRSNSSFPSSHAANAFALAAVFARRWRRPALAFWGTALLVSFSRMYLNRHFLSDVVVGAALGVLFAWLGGRLASRLGWDASPPARPDPPRDSSASSAALSDDAHPMV